MSMLPGDEPQEALSLADALAASRESEGPDTTITEGEPAAVAAPAIPAEPAWEPPAWTQRWKPEARDALGRFASNAELKQYYTPLQQQIEEMYGYTTRRDQEFAKYRERLDPIHQVLQPYEQRYQLAGIPIHQGLQQLLGYADLLDKNPDQAFGLLGGSYKPQDAATAINQLARQWGVDLGSLMQEQPYQDPSITALLTPLQQELQNLRQTVHQQQAGQQHQQQQALVKEISDFEAAKDENGSLRHPYFADVFNDMVTLVNLGHAKSVSDAYELAVRHNPDVQQKLQAEAAEKARKAALAEASARTAAAEKSESASRNVQGKSRSAATPNHKLSIREGFEQAERSLGFAEG